MALKGSRLLWNMKMTPEALIKQTENFISNARKSYDKIATISKDKCNFENFLKPMIDVDCDYDTYFYQCEMTHFLSPNKDLRIAGLEGEKMLTDFTLETNMRKDLYGLLLALETKQIKHSQEADRYLNKQLIIRKRLGLHLLEDSQKRVKDLQMQITDLKLQSLKNISDDKTYVEFSESDLEGLPKDFINNLSLCADSQKRKVTMKYPDFFPVMKFCKVPDTRKKLYIAFNTRLKDNVHIIEKMASLRHELANELGYATFSDYRSDVLMAKSAKNIESFLLRLAKIITPFWNKEKECYLRLKEKECKALKLTFDGKLNAWDLLYFGQQFEKENFFIDEEKLKEYFSLNVVTKGLFEIYQLLLGLTFQKIENTDVWHPDVQTFSVTDKDSGQLMGYFFLDLFPRDGKYTHYAEQQMQQGCLGSDGTRQSAMASIMGNFPKPTAEKPSLLNHEEVTRYFHEFGHVMHFICNRANYSFFSGTKVDKDFLEVPSQMLENWCWTSESLKLMSAHYLDGSPLPEELLNALIKSESANVGYFYLRIICNSLIDQKIHTQAKPDTAAINKALNQEILGLEILDGTNSCAHFNHLYDDYAACYYCYMWSRVFSSDMFETRFFNNVLNPEVGKEYRTKILEPGGTKDPIDLLKDFIGREPNDEAFLKRQGFC